MVKSNFILKWKAASKSWLFLSIGVAVLILLPIAVLFVAFFEPVGDGWNQIVDNLIIDYTINTLILIVGVSVLSLLFAVIPAWLVSNYKFPFSGLLKWLLILPLAIPTYIVSFIYVDIFSYGGEFYSLLNLLFGISEKDFYFDILKIYYLIPILASVLYPYVYITCLSAFEGRNRKFIEAAQMLGSSKKKLFYKIALPLSRPAIVSGLFLVNMEVLNDYGAMKYFGVSTYTTGIFSAWFGMNDLGSAIRLALILFGIVILFLSIERMTRGRSSYKESDDHSPVKKLIPKKSKRVLYLLICLVPILIGFIVPVLKLIYNSLENISVIYEIQFIEAFFNSTMMAIISAVVMTVGAIILVYSEKTNKFKNFGLLTRAASSGYAIPGAVIAVGMILFMSGLELITGIYAFGTLIILLYAYNVRFMAAAYSPIKSATEKSGTYVLEASKVLGKGDFTTFLKVEYPIIQPAVFSALLIGVVEVLKELPLTLILRPFNFETMATLAFQYANNEMLKEASVYSLFIVLIAVLPLLILKKSYKV